jgi:hypothetical protein
MQQQKMPKYRKNKCEKKGAGEASLQNKERKGGAQHFSLIIFGESLDRLYETVLHCFYRYRM